MSLLTQQDIDREPWMGDQRAAVTALLRAYEQATAQLEATKKTLGPRLTAMLDLALASGIRADPRVDEAVAVHAQASLAFLGFTPEQSQAARDDNADEGTPGTPLARLSYLLDELEKRFPGVVNPVMSDPPEPKLLAALDAKIASLKVVIAECLVDLRSPFPAEAQVIARLGMGDSSIEKAAKVLNE